MSAVYDIDLENGWKGRLSPGKTPITITVGPNKFTGTLKEYAFKLSNEAGHKLEFSLYKTEKDKWYDPFYYAPAEPIPLEILQAGKMKIEEINSQQTIKF